MMANLNYFNLMLSNTKDIIIESTCLIALTAPFFNESLMTQELFYIINEEGI